MRWLNIRGVALLAAISLVVLALGCAAKPHDPIEAAPTLPPLLVVHPQLGDAVRSITLPGDLVGYYESTLYAKVTGYVRSIAVDKGDRVKQGEVLAVIEVPELHQRLDQALADLEIHRVTYQRLDKVWNTDSRLVAREDVDVAYAKYQEAKAGVAELRALESYTRITAPFDGIITGRFVDPGALVKIGGGGSVPGGLAGFALDAQEVSSHPSGGATPVLSEAMINILRTYIYVPQDTVLFIHRGMPAKLSIQAMAGRRFTGAVTRFTHSLDFSTRTMLTEVDIQNPGRELYPG
ncbi:MAG: efflux RND transporter periplasmic adaptor subunit, partial [Candidatus Binataceae bacterium]